VPVTTLPVDGDKIGELFFFIMAGLIWYHWGVLLSPDTGVWAGCLNQRGVEIYGSLLPKNARARVIENLGNGTFTYQGAQGTDSRKRQTLRRTLEDSNSAARFPTRRP
jgi:hypothetical protein